MVIRFLILGFFIFSFPVNLKASSKREKLLNQMEKRKKAFESYLKDKKKRNQKKISVADNQKNIREEVHARQEKIKRLFKREKKKVYRKVYKIFVNWRKEKRKKLEEARSQYAQMQKELRRVTKMKKYKINEKKEFDLH